FNLRLGLAGKRIYNQREALGTCWIEFQHRRRVERLGVTATQCHSADVLGIDRLPAHRYLWLLRVVGRMCCWEGGAQHGRSILAVPFLALGKVYFKAIEAREVPCRAGERHSYFLIDAPDITVHPRAFTIRRTDRLERCIEGVRPAIPSLSVVLATDRKRDRTGRKIKQVAVKGGVTQWHFELGGVMKTYIHPVDRRVRVATKCAHEGIKRCRGISSEQRFSQTRLANLT